MEWRYWDLVIAGFGFLTQCGLALLGLTLTQWKNKMAFGALVLFGLIITVVAVMRGLDSADKVKVQLDTIQQNTQKPKEHTHLEFIQPVELPGHFLPFRRGEQLAVNVGYRNAGTFVMTSSNMGVSVQLMLRHPSHDAVENTLKTIPFTQPYGVLLGNSPSYTYHSFAGPVLAEEDAARLTHRHAIVTILGVVRWKDASGEYETHLACYAVLEQDGKINWHTFLENNEEVTIAAN